METLHDIAFSVIIIFIAVILIWENTLEWHTKYLWDNIRCSMHMFYMHAL